MGEAPKKMSQSTAKVGTPFAELNSENKENKK